VKVLRTGQAIVEAFLAEGVEVVFGLPGGHILGVYDGLYHTPQIRHVLVRHEHTAASMAAGYAQLTGRPGVVLVTAGPGATNLVTAVAEAYVGALPMVILAGRATTATAHKGAGQEVATERIFGPIPKSAVRADRADHVVDLVRQAFLTARGGKPGPVLVDLPRDLFEAEVEFGGYQPSSLYSKRIAAPDDVVERAAAELLEARRPLLVAGGGTVASGAFEELRELAELLRAPVLTSLSGRGALSDAHPLAAGGLGAHRNDLAKRLLVEADVLLGLGTRFEEMETNWRPGFVPAADARYVQVDLDEREFGRSVPVHVPVLGDVRTVLRQLLERVRPARTGSFVDDPRVREVAEGVRAIEAEVAAAIAVDEVPLSPLRVIRTARDVFPPETTVGVDVGCLAEHIAGSFPFFRVFEPRSFLSPSSFYGMGFVASAAPVAKIVYPDRPGLCFVGDGSFQMVLPVLPMATENGLAVTWCVLDDQALGSIKDLQEFRFAERYLATDFAVQPDLAGIARACGCYGEEVREPGDIEPALRRALAANEEGRPAVLDFRVYPLRMTQSRDHFSLHKKPVA
jgi:acetolactate synthase-1/2/3 large subunit